VVVVIIKRDRGWCVHVFLTPVTGGLKPSKTNELLPAVEAAIKHEMMWLENQPLESQVLATCVPFDSAQHDFAWYVANCKNVMEQRKKHQKAFQEYAMAFAEHKRLWKKALEDELVEPRCGYDNLDSAPRWAAMSTKQRDEVVKVKDAMNQTIGCALVTRKMERQTFVMCDWINELLTLSMFGAKLIKMLGLE
jgi:hypothetical protein